MWIVTRTTAPDKLTVSQQLPAISQKLLVLTQPCAATKVVGVELQHVQQLQNDRKSHSDTPVRSTDVKHQAVAVANKHMKLGARSKVQKKDNKWRAGRHIARALKKAITTINASKGMKGSMTHAKSKAATSPKAGNGNQLSSHTPMSAISTFTEERVSNLSCSMGEPSRKASTSDEQQKYVQFGRKQVQGGHSGTRDEIHTPQGQHGSVANFRLVMRRCEEGTWNVVTPLPDRSHPLPQKTKEGRKSCCTDFTESIENYLMSRCGTQNRKDDIKLQHNGQTDHAVNASDDLSTNAQDTSKDRDELQQVPPRRRDWTVENDGRNGTGTVPRPSLTSGKAVLSRDVCPECAKSFENKCLLLYHIVQCHLPTRPKGLNCFKQHVKNVHLGQNEICPYCHKAFSQKYNLSYHIREQHEKPRTTTGKEFYPPDGTQCTICNRTYVYRHSLLRHIRIKHWPALASTRASTEAQDITQTKEHQVAT